MSTATLSTDTTETVRTELTAWLDENWDPEITLAEWWGRLAAGGWAHPALPTTAGGRGSGRDLCSAVSTVLADAGLVGPPLGLGYMPAAPAPWAHRTPAQVGRSGAGARPAQVAFQIQMALTVLGSHLQDAVAKRRSRVLRPNHLGFADVSVAVEDEIGSSWHRRSPD